MTSRGVLYDVTWDGVRGTRMRKNHAAWKRVCMQTIADRKNDDENYTFLNDVPYNYYVKYS